MVGSIHEEIDPLSTAMLVQEETAAEGALTPSKAMLRCYGCSEFGNPNIKRCACQSAYFCGKDCQQKGWKLHKQECGAIRNHITEEQQEHARNLELAAKLMTEPPPNHFTCSVCLDEKEEEHRNTVKLPCGHHFCYQCISEVQYSAYEKGFSNEAETCVGLCPVCRQPMPYLDYLVAERVQALLALARIQHNKQERDRVCAVALMLVDFVLEKTPGKMLPQQFQGDVYSTMEQHDHAVMAYKKAYTVLKQTSRLGKTSGVSSDEYDERMQSARAFEKKEPENDFPDDVSYLEKELDPIFAIGGGSMITVSLLFISLSRALARCEGQEAKASALQLSLLVQKINKPMAAQCGGCRTVDTDCTKAIAECYLAVGNVGQARKILRKAIQRFRYLSGLHRIMAECEKHKGNLEKALFYAAKGYFYEETWNEEGTRAKNLQLWNDIRDSMLQQTEKTENRAASDEVQ